MTDSFGLFSATFQAVATLLVIGVLGFWLISRRIIGAQALASLSALAIDVALPCLIFANIVGTFNPSASTGWWLMPLYWAGFTVITFLLTMLSGFLSARATRGEFRACLFYQNGIFLPLTIIVQLFGPGSPSLASLFLFTLLYPAFFFTTAPVFFKAGLSFNRQRVFNPVLLSTIAALAVKLTGLDAYIPVFVTSSLKQVGAVSIPLLMIIVGGSVFLDLQQQGRKHYLEIAKFVLMKNILFPLATLGALILIKPTYQVALIIMLQAAVPPITALPVFAERHQGDRGIVNQFTVASFLGALVTVPAAIMLFGRFFA